MVMNLPLSSNVVQGLGGSVAANLLKGVTGAVAITSVAGLFQGQSGHRLPGREPTRHKALWLAPMPRVEQAECTIHSTWPITPILTFMTLRSARW